ncbi:MAG: alpha/beta hydrolase-fold protein [Pyrinomonadaceae bacterium]
MKLIKIGFVFISLFAFTVAAYAQQPTPSLVPQPVIKTFQLDSKLMARQMPYSVIFPANYEVDTAARFPVIYMMHGLGGSYKITKLSSVKYTDKQRVILVFVEGDHSFFTDSATKPNDKYETYIINELIPEVDKKLRTIPSRQGRAVAGASMGGYGALKFGIKYPQLFSLAVSWSGAVNVTAFHDAKDLPPIPGLKMMLTTVFGDGKDRTVVNANDLTKLFTEYPADKLKDLPFFYLDCGTEDELGLFKPNRDLAELMINRKIPHEYREFPGGHGVNRHDTFPDLYELSEQIFAKQKAASAK